MSTTIEKEFDYKEYYKTHDIDQTKIHSYEERQQRFEALAKDTAVLRIDKDILDDFVHIEPDKKKREKLICQTLREFLISRDMKKMIREDFHDMLVDTLSSIQPALMSTVQAEKEAVAG